jgi:hypothetical protein
MVSARSVSPRGLGDRGDVLGDLLDDLGRVLGRRQLDHDGLAVLRGARGRHALRQVTVGERDGDLGEGHDLGVDRAGHIPLPRRAPAHEVLADDAVDAAGGPGGDVPPALVRHERRAPPEVLHDLGVDQRGDGVEPGG